MSALTLSVVVSLVSAVAYAGAAILQEQAAVAEPDSTFVPLRNTSWWVALGLNGLGGLLHVVALAYGPLSLVQPLGALTIVFVLPMAAVLVRRKAGAAAWRGALLATAGLAGLLALTGSADAQSLAPVQRLGLGLGALGAVAAVVLLAQVSHRHPAARSVLLAGAAGIAFGIASVFTKTVTVDVSADSAVGQLPSLGAIAVFATAGVLLSQASYRGAGLTAPLATVTVVNPVVAAIVGLTMFGESFRHGALGAALAFCCALAATAGLILLTTERLSRESDAAAVPAGQPDDAPTEGGHGPDRTAPFPGPGREAPAGVPAPRSPADPAAHSGARPAGALPADTVAARAVDPRDAGTGPGIAPHAVSVPAASVPVVPGPKKTEPVNGGPVGSAREAVTAGHPWDMKVTVPRHRRGGRGGGGRGGGAPATPVAHAEPEACSPGA